MLAQEGGIHCWFVIFGVVLLYYIIYLFNNYVYVMYNI